MKVGFSGRPAPPREMRAPFGSTPLERMQRYVSACSEMELGCLEVPATLVFGKGDWRNQFLSACTEPVRAEPKRTPSPVDVLVRVRFTDGVDPRAAESGPCTAATLTLRQAPNTPVRRRSCHIAVQAIPCFSYWKSPPSSHRRIRSCKSRAGR